MQLKNFSFILTILNKNSILSLFFTKNEIKQSIIKFMKRVKQKTLV